MTEFQVQDTAKRKPAASISVTKKKGGGEAAESASIFRMIRKILATAQSVTTRLPTSKAMDTAVSGFKKPICQVYFVLRGSFVGDDGSENDGVFKVGCMSWRNSLLVTMRWMSEI